MEFVSIELEDEVGSDYSIRMVVQAEVICVDYGVGWHEFWGSKGYHEDIRKDLNSTPTIEEVELFDEDCEPVEIGPDEQRLIDGWFKLNSSRIEEKLLEKAYED